MNDEGIRTASNRSIVRSLVAVAALAVLGVVAATFMLAEEAEASHYRSGTLYGIPTGGNTVSMEGRIAFRASYPNAETFPPQPPSFPCTPGSMAPTAWFSFNLVATNNAGTVTVGSTTANLKVLVCNTVDDWFLGKIVDAGGNTGVPLTFPTPLDSAGLPWKVYWSSFCRISNVSPNYHINNPCTTWRLETTIDLSGTPDNPTRPFVNPIVQCPINAACAIPIPYLDDDLTDVHSMRWATGPEAAGGGSPASAATFYQPGPCPGCGAALAATLDNSDPANLVLNWDTTGAPLSPIVPGLPCRGTWSTQVVLEDGREKSPMEFLIHVCDSTFVPEWIPAPGQSDTACNQSPTAIVGGIITFSVWAEITAPGRTLEVIPLEYPDNTVITNIVTGAVGHIDFTWDTTGALPGEYLAVFFAQDSVGLTGDTCIVRITLMPGIPLDFTWTFTGTSPQDLTLDAVQFTDVTAYPADFAAAPRNWLWTFSDPNDPGSRTIQHPTHEYTSGANGAGMPYLACMQLTVTFTAGPWVDDVCHDVYVHNRPPLPMPFVMTNIGGQLRMTDAGSDPDGFIVAYSWEWGDGSDPTLTEFAVHRYAQNGDYNVCLTTTDNQGSVAQRCVLIHIQLPEPWQDTDLDGIPDAADNCPEIQNREQEDANQDGLGDACQDLPPDFSDEVPPSPEEIAARDRDYDGVDDVADNCPDTPNREQTDTDGDMLGDFCDFDLDGDGVSQWGAPGTPLDNCPMRANPDQRDSDGDGVGDACAGAGGAAIAVVDLSNDAQGPPLREEHESADEGSFLFGKDAAAGMRFLVVGLVLLGLVGLGATMWAMRRWHR